jgi:hypothetical protein
MSFTELDENKNGVSKFAYGDASGFIVCRGGDKHIQIRIGKAEINAFVEDADALLNVFAELLIQDARWEYDMSLDANANEVF